MLGRCMEIMNTQDVLAVPQQLLFEGGYALAEGKIVVIMKHGHNAYQCWPIESK